MSKGLEIERKFLVRMPQLDKLNVRRELDIVQTYLNNGEDGSQRRVRKITENNNVSYTYTEKIFVTPVTREENEKNISCREYESLIENDMRPESTEIRKKRCVIEWKGQNFELDIYPFSSEFATLELELGSPEQEIYFPEDVEIIREVTGEKAYSNVNLALSGKFPETVL